MLKIIDLRCTGQEGESTTIRLASDLDFEWIGEGSNKEKAKFVCFSGGVTEIRKV